jgi:hypothetical protein
MAEQGLGIGGFVRGMVWHDIGKPFHLGTGGHVWLGYWLLLRAGYPAEALVALTHGGGKWDKDLKPTLKEWFRQPRNPLPAVLLFASPLDQIAASVYSLLSRRIDRASFMGKEDDRDETKNPLFHAWQNPFSRLVMNSENLEGPFIIRESNDAAKVPHRRVTQLDEPLRDRLIAALPDDWKPFIQRSDLDKATSPKAALEATPAPADGTPLLRTLESFLCCYPERTYPPANDTTLLEHGRLSGALAFVLYRNLQQKTPAWLSRHIRYSDGKYVLGSDGDASEVSKHLSPDRSDAQEPWNDVRKTACTHLGAHLVRVAFDGHREVYDSALRVDDLLGARALTQRFLDTFERELAEVLGASELMWESEGDSRRYLLTLNRSQFDLFYLLPPQPGPAGGMTIDQALGLAYERTLDAIVAELVEELRRDFRRAVEKGKLTFGQEEARTLRRQLRTLGYRVRNLALEIPPLDTVLDFAAFTCCYGDALVKRFHDALDYAVVPTSERSSQIGIEEGDAALPPDETCDVCGNHPVFQPFADLLEDENWRPYVQKAVHHFRGEPERPCLSCITRRMLSHGVVARETRETLQEMVVWANPEAEKPRRVIAVQPQEGPLLPPALVSSAALEGDDDFQDLGAAFARYHRRADGTVDHRAPPDLFPTVSYAADATGNVVLLALRPTDDALYGPYSYTQAAAVEALPEEIARGDRAPETDEERWQASFALLYQWVKKREINRREEQERKPDLAGSMASVRPHLARVMERVRRLGDFYRALIESLDKGVKEEDFTAPVRVLPLDAGLPTLRLLLPADQLGRALRVLDRVMTESLFSATYFKDLQERERSHRLLRLLVPHLLHGALILFKQKFPLYLVLEAERDLFCRLAHTDLPGEPSGQDNRSDGYGLRLAFTDLRGTLSQVGPERARATYANVARTLDLAETVDRRTVLLRAAAEAAEHVPRELADALTTIRADRARLSLDKARELQEEETFAAVLFLKRAARG